MILVRTFSPRFGISAEGDPAKPIVTPWKARNSAVVLNTTTEKSRGCSASSFCMCVCIFSGSMCVSSQFLTHTSAYFALSLSSSHSLAHVRSRCLAGIITGLIASVCFLFFFFVSKGLFVFFFILLRGEGGRC